MLYGNAGFEPTMRTFQRLVTSLKIYDQPKAGLSLCEIKVVVFDCGQISAEALLLVRVFSCLQDLE